ncbi:MAG: hypothetical protein JXB34_05305 [Bacteroidales bacterium]|nr:hypothetical protein [Bacteroidales bacterium]
MKHIVRILPFKPHIAKVLLTTQSGFKHYYNNDRIDETIFFKTDLFREKLLFVYDLFDSSYLVKQSSSKFLNTDIRENPKYNLKLCSKTMKVDNYINDYRIKGYQLLKYNLPDTYSKEKHSIIEQQKALKDFVKKTNYEFSLFAISIIDFLCREKYKTIKQCVDAFYWLYTIKDEDYSKDNFIRNIYRNGFGLNNNIPDKREFKISIRHQDEFQRMTYKPFIHFENQQIISIYKKYWKEEASYRKLAIEFNTSKSTIQRIVNSLKAEEIFRKFEHIRKLKDKREYFKEPIKK